MNSADYLNGRFPAQAKKKTKSRVIIGIVLIGIALILRLQLGALSYNSFVLGDHLLNFTQIMPPFVMWGIAGLFFGAVIGSIVITKKYKLPLKWNLPAIGGLVVFFLAIYLNHSPLLSNAGMDTRLGRSATKFIEISASSSVPDYQGHHYGPDNLLNSDASKAWMYIEKENKPETVSFVFNGAKMSGFSNVELTSIRLSPGYTKNYETWKTSNKPKDYIVYKNNEELARGQFEERFADERIAFSQLPVKAGDTIRIAITSSYKPVNRKVNIIAITEMYLMVNYREPR